MFKLSSLFAAPKPPPNITGSSLLCAHQSTQQPTTSTTTTDTEIPPTTGIKNTSIVAIGVVASLIILSSCIVIYKYCMTVSDFEIIPLTPMVPVSVVVVYPAESPAFQRAVVALAEFLQWHGGCRVAIDMWQQEKIAELGPLRWLADQVKNADRVLIVSPQAKTTSSLQGHSTPTKSLPEHSIPAAAHDLYPLVLNMVASHAKSATELARFWVVKLHPKNNKKSCVLLPELCTCKIFCLIKDLNKLCKNLHAEKAGKKIWSILVKPEAFYNQNSTAKLREAIEMLGANKPQISNGINHPDLC
ncbi:interleukin-17 receptor B [Cyprinodon tularosa]|uniref:interleukin-17 receptor B n=1 Tax=Cyprinodon tularosa TaxID=77115 RepID=UPI0018E20B3D|nr:interleukin-17 receptor B [Cyprinodon tularosa]